MTWLVSNIGTIVAALVILASIVGIIISLKKDKKAGKSTCGGNCAHCSFGGMCHSQPNASQRK